MDLIYFHWKLPTLLLWIRSLNQKCFYQGSVPTYPALQISFYWWLIDYSNKSIISSCWSTSCTWFYKICPPPWSLFAYSVLYCNPYVFLHGMYPSLLDYEYMWLITCSWCNLSRVRCYVLSHLNNPRMGISPWPMGWIERKQNNEYNSSSVLRIDSKGVVYNYRQKSYAYVKYWYWVSKQFVKHGQNV